MGEELTPEPQPALDWLMADPERWQVYLAGREAGYTEGTAEGWSGGYEEGRAVGVQTVDGYESGAVAGFEAGYLSRQTDEALELGSHVMVFRPSELERAEYLAQSRGPDLPPDEMVRGAYESWGLEYPDDKAEDDALERFDQAS